MGEKKDLTQHLLKEIDLIQNTINRMASNSFFVKGWTLTLVVGALLLKGDKYQVLIAFIPLIGFWFLDAYFLWQERLYRKLYEWVIANRLEKDDYLFDMNAYRFKDQIDSKCKIMFSLTLIWFYGLILVLLVLYSLFLIFIQKGGG